MPPSTASGNQSWQLSVTIAAPAIGKFVSIGMVSSRSGLVAQKVARRPYGPWPPSKTLKSGRISIPGGAEPIVWIASGGKVKQTPKENGKPKDKRFGRICDAYFKEQEEEEAKAATTLAAEQTHISHLKRLIGQTRSIDKVDLDALKRYRTRRQKEKYRGKVIGEALRRELATFRLVWISAQDNEYVSVPCPLLRLDGHWRIRLPKPAAHMDFQTWQQIERRINRGGLTDEQIKTQSCFMVAGCTTAPAPYIDSLTMAGTFR